MFSRLNEITILESQHILMAVTMNRKYYLVGFFNTGFVIWRAITRDSRAGGIHYPLLINQNLSGSVSNIIFASIYQSFYLQGVVASPCTKLREVDINNLSPTQTFKTFVHFCFQFQYSARFKLRKTGP